MSRFLSPLRYFKNKGIPRLWVILLVIGLMFYFAMVQGGFISWFIFYAFLPVAGYILILLFYPFKSIIVSRVVQNTQLFAGDTLHLRIILRRKLPIPFFLVTVCEAEEDEGNARPGASVSGTFLWLGTRASFSCSIPDIKRGKHTFSSIELKTEDPFGFYRKRVRISCESVIIVYPKVRPVGFSENRPGKAFNPLSQETDFSQFSGLRAYQPSDRLSWLDWKSTAKTSHLVTKQYEPEGESQASVVFVSQEFDSDELFERGVSFTASLVQTLLRNHFNVRLTCGAVSKTLMIRQNNRKEWSEAFLMLAELTKKDALRSGDVPISNKEKRAGFAVSTDPEIVGKLGRNARSSGLSQTLFYVSDRNRGESVSRYASLFSAIFIVSSDDFGKILKARI